MENDVLQHYTWTKNASHHEVFGSLLSSFSNEPEKP